MTSSIDTLVHFGAGRCSELDTYLKQDINRIFLVEADPDLAEDLKLRTADYPKISVVHAAVSDAEGLAMLHRYNLPEVNSLHEPAEPLIRLFPGLRLLEKLQVKTVNPINLVQPLELQQDQANLLIIDLPGNELPVIRALHQGKQIESFRYLKLYCGREPLYTDNIPANELLTWLEKQGFDQYAEDSGADPDRPGFLLKRNDFLLRCQDLQEQLATLTREKNEAVMLAASHKRLAEENLHKQEQTLKERNEQTRLAEQRQTALNQSNIERAKLIESYTAKVNELSGAIEEKTRHLNEQETKLQQLTNERDEQIKLAEQHQATLHQSNAEWTKLIESHTSKANELSGVIEEKTRRLNEQETRLQRLTRERDEQAKLAGERLAVIEKMSKDHEDQSWRQHQLDEELVKAEAQIKLISDVLIREKAF